MNGRSRFSRAARTTVAGLLAILPAAACGTADAPALTVLSVPERQNAASSVAARGSEVVVAWGATPAEGAAQIFIARSENGGRTFGAPVRVSDDTATARASGEQAPRVAISDRGIAVMWTAKRDGLTEIRLAQSTDGGRTFGASRTVHPPGLPAMRGWGSIAAGPDGAWHLAWLDGRQSAATQSAAPHVHGASHGASRQDLYHARIASDGAVAETALATDVCFCCKTSVQPAGADIVVAWRHIFPGSLRDIAFAKFPAGSPAPTSVAPTRVSHDDWRLEACPDDGPAVAVDGAGMLHIAWPSVTDTASGQRAVFYASSPDGRTFTTRRRLDDPAAGVASHPQIAVTPGGDVTVVWDQALEGTRRTFLVEGRGDRWSPVEPLSNGNPASYPAVAATADGTIVVWTSHSTPYSGIAASRRPNDR